MTRPWGARRARPEDDALPTLDLHDARELIAAKIDFDAERYARTRNGYWACTALGLWGTFGRSLGIPLPDELCSYLGRLGVAVSLEPATGENVLSVLQLAKRKGGAQFARQAEAEHRQLERLGAFERASRSGMTDADAYREVARQFPPTTPGAVRSLVTRWRKRGARGL